MKPDDWRVLEAYDFPGNVRELRNLLERSLLQTPPEGNWLEMDRAWLRKMRLTAPPLSVGPSEAPDHPLSLLEDQEYLLIQKVLKEENCVIRRAAAKLGISNQSLLRRLEKWPQLRPHPGP